MSDREQFEAHMHERGEDYLYRRDVKGSALFGQYCSQTVQDHWEIWRASRRAALEEAVSAVLSASLDAIWADGRLMDPREVGSACAEAIRALAEGDKQ